jgi:hypothetical protein
MLTQTRLLRRLIILRYLHLEYSLAVLTPMETSWWFRPSVTDVILCYKVKCIRYLIFFSLAVLRYVFYSVFLDLLCRFEHGLLSICLINNAPSVISLDCVERFYMQQYRKSCSRYVWKLKFFKVFPDCMAEDFLYPVCVHSD